MKQVAKTQQDGEVRVVDVPAPIVRDGGVLVRTGFSLISAGTERARLELSDASLLGKARAKPDEVRQVLDAARHQGVVATYRKVRERLGELEPLGYSSAGTVIEVGKRAGDLRVGQRVACAGVYASHGEVAFVPKNLCAAVPAGVPLEHAAFATVGAIALHGVRQADVRLGERVAVVGLGLVGILTVQLLRAAGCRVLGVDPDARRRQLAAELGCDEVAEDGSEAEARAGNVAPFGFDASIVAAASSSSEPLELAARLCRDRGTMVMVGDVGMDAPRELLYRKELTLRLSRSYGPGRYDPAYEEKGRDYPVGYVRWTEQRNMAAVLDFMASGDLTPDALISHTIPLERAPEAYRMIREGDEPYLGVLLDCGGAVDDVVAGKPSSSSDAAGEEQPSTGATPGGAAPRAGAAPAEPATSARRTSAAPPHPEHSSGAVGDVGIGLIGAGSFATGTLIPALRAVPGTRLVAVASAAGLSARDAEERHGFRYAADTAEQIFGDPAVDAVVIATRHDSHARLVADALGAGKRVFVEKPLALTRQELARVVEAAVTSSASADAAADRPPVGEGAAADQPADSRLADSLVLAPVTVGFNRRFAPGVLALRAFFADAHEPLALHYRVNAGYLPPDHWLHDPEIGGGRILGEACHFVDLLGFLAGEPPEEVFAQALPDAGRYHGDNVSVQIRYRGGTVGTLHYLANGDRGVAKERLEMFGGGRVGVLDDLRRVELSRDGKVSRSGHRWSGQDKGHRAEIRAFVEARRGRPAPVPLDRSVLSTLTTFAVLDSLRSGRAVAVPAPDELLAPDA